MTADSEPMDLGRPLRGIDQLSALVAYIYRAHPNNETDWLEWKTGLDLGSAGGQFEIARQILGFANRDPDVARRHAGGVAYLVLGVEPGNACGQNPVDNAEPTAGIGRYVARQRPAWSPLWVPFEGRSILVVTVEAPQWGDPIHTLQRDYEGTQAGSVFVRRPGSTDRARPDDVRMLERRLLRGGSRLEQLILTSSGGPVGTIDLSEEAVERWLEHSRDVYLSPMRAEQTRSALERHARDVRGMVGFTRFVETTAAASAALTDAIAPLVGRRVEEDRTPEQFESEVDKWIAAARPLVAGAAGYRFLHDPSSQFVLAVENPTERNVPDLQIEVTLPDGVVPFAGDPEPVALPAAPRPWGPHVEGGIDLGALARPTLSAGLFGPAPRPLATSGRTVSGHVVRYWFDHLRPGARREAKPIRLLVAQDRVGECVGRWSATSSGLDGIIAGELTILLGPRQEIEVHLSSMPR